MMTAQTATLDALAYIGVFAVQPTGQPGDKFITERPAILRWLAREMTGTLQTMYRRREDLFRRRLCFTASAPVTQNVTVTQNSAAVGITTPFGFNLDGATISIGGTWNQARQDANGNVTLFNPWSQPGGTVAMVAYGDCLPLDPTLVKGVFGSVYREGVVPLSALTNRTDWATYDQGLVSDYGRRYINTTRAVFHLPGPPTAYWVETGEETAGNVLRLHLAPLPDQAYEIELDAQLRAPVITSANIGTNTTDPGVGFNLKGDFDESIFMPLFLNAWCGSPWFRDKDAQASLQARAAEATEALNNETVQSKAGASITLHGF